MQLENRNAIVYGAGGGIGSAVSTAFAREGARVFLVGRTREPLERVAKEIHSGGGRADIAVFDALDRPSTTTHGRSSRPPAASTCRSTSSTPATSRAFP
jgi:3-oxoacyl-[acyl-carrier protein] reductase